jgi:hypothetical protein
MPNAAERDRVIESLDGSRIYGDHILVKPVTDWLGLTGYLLKEATPQAWCGAGKSFRRIGGSIPLGAQGGDRVLLSDDLRAILVRDGRVEPYRRTYAKRLSKPPAFPAEVEIRYLDSLFDHEPLPILTAPPKPKTAPRVRGKIAPPSLPLVYPPSIADLLAGLGPTHGAAAELVGLSRPQVTNIIVGRFGASRRVVRQVLHLARAA